MFWTLTELMKKIIYLSHHKQSITGGQKYNDAFETYLEELSGIKAQSTPSCSQTYSGWKKILSPFAELRHLRKFSKDTLVMFTDSTYKYHLLLALINKYVCHAKTSMIVHHFPFAGGFGLVWRINKWLMCKYTSMMDSIIVPSPYTLDIAKNLFPHKQIIYVPLAFERKFMKSLDYEQGNLLYVGTIEERKGLNYLIEAISLLSNKKSVKLTVVGKVVCQTYYKKLQRQVNELGLTDNVIFLGRVSDEILTECYQKAEIFTFPSLLEGYGIVLVEAYNNGLPIICFDNSAMPYTVKNGVNGFVVKNKDAKDFATKIQLLVGNAALRSKLQRGIKNTVMHLKTVEDFEKGIRDFWAVVLNT